MFNIIETLQNYLTRELLPNNLSSEVALHFSVIKSVAAIFGGKLFGGSALLASGANAITGKTYNSTLTCFRNRISLYIQLQSWCYHYYHIIVT